jgi:hypothetical protein
MHQSAEFAIRPPAGGGGMQFAGRHALRIWLTTTVCAQNGAGWPVNHKQRLGNDGSWQIVLKSSKIGETNKLR